MAEHRLSQESVLVLVHKLLGAIRVEKARNGIDWETSRHTDILVRSRQRLFRGEFQEIYLLRRHLFIKGINSQDTYKSSISL